MSHARAVRVGMPNRLAAEWRPGSAGCVPPCWAPMTELSRRRAWWSGGWRNVVPDGDPDRGPGGTVRRSAGDGLGEYVSVSSQHVAEELTAHDPLDGHAEAELGIHLG
jgi:hypothetical protein